MKAVKPIEPLHPPQTILILNDIRSIINVGAIFRTADAVGVNQIILSGVSPAPIDRFGRVRGDFAKASLGSEHSVAWEQVENITKTIKDLKKQGYIIIAIEQAKNSIHFKKYSLKKGQKIVIVPGNEVDGVPKAILKLADVILELPMRGMKESLNVSVATGIILYHLLDN
jgi:23S rRNA (guanosine2251-2'-O)-methyltransferase